MLAPVLEKISNENSDLNIVKVDIDESVELAIKYQKSISSINSIYHRAIIKYNKRRELND